VAKLSQLDLLDLRKSACLRSAWLVLPGAPVPKVHMPAPSILRKPVGREILRYLVRHPEANDTVEGIVEWWLLDQKIEESVAEVKAVLDELIEQGLVVAWRGADGRTHYRAEVEKKRQIMDCLNARQASGEKS
jgi:hypothetical protein